MNTKHHPDQLWNRDFILLLLVFLCSSFAISILMSLLPVHVLAVGGSNTITGLMTTGMTVLTMSTNLIVAPLIDRVGRKKLLVLGSALYFLNLLLFCFTNELGVLFVLRVFCGFTQGIFFPVMMTMVADIAPEEQLVDALGISGAASSVAFAITPTIGLAIYTHLGSRAMFISAALMGGLAFLFTLLIREHFHSPQPAREKKKGKKAGSFSLASLSVILLPAFVSMTVIFANSSVVNFLTPCGLSRGLEQISLYFLANQGTVFFVRLFVGRVLQLISKRLCTGIGLLLTAGGIALIAIAHTIPAMLVSAILIGLGFTAVTQIFQAETLVAVSSDRRGLASTVYMLLVSFGNGSGSALWGAISTVSGYTLTYALAGLSALAGIVLHQIYWRRQSGELREAAPAGDAGI